MIVRDESGSMRVRARLGGPGEDGRRVVLAAACALAAFRIGVRLWLGLRGYVYADEGSYFSTAALLARGHVLYGDAAAAHPPLTFLLFAPFTWIGAPATGLAVCRLVSGALGGVTAWLIGDTVRRRAGTTAAVVAIAVYAVLPEVAQAERSVMTEGLLNLMAAGAARAWLVGGADDGRETGGELAPRRTGIWWGLAVLTKFWGVLMAPAVVVTAALRGSVRPAWRASFTMIVTAVVGLAPFLFLAATPFFRQVVLFSLFRDTDGSSAADRLPQIVGGFGDAASFRALPATAVFVAGLVVAVAQAVRRREADELLVFGLVWQATLAAAFLVGPYYYVQYNAHLGPAVALVAGGLVGRAARVASGIPAAVRTSVVAVAIAAVGVAAVGVVRTMGDRGADPSASIARLVSHVRGCLWADEPGWLVVADRLPDVDRFGPAATEPNSGFAAVSIAAGEGVVSNGPAVGAARRTIAASCPSLLLAPSTVASLGPDAEAFERTHRRVAIAGPDGPELWVRR